MKLLVPDATVLQQPINPIKDHVSSAAERVVVMRYLDDHPTPHKCNELLFDQDRRGDLSEMRRRADLELDFKHKNIMKMSSLIKKWFEKYTDISEKAEYGMLSWCASIISTFG